MYKASLPFGREMLPRFAFHGNAHPPGFGEAFLFFRVFGGVTRPGSSPPDIPGGDRGPGGGGPDPRHASPPGPESPFYCRIMYKRRHDPAARACQAMPGNDTPGPPGNTGPDPVKLARSPKTRPAGPNCFEKRIVFD